MEVCSTSLDLACSTTTAFCHLPQHWVVLLPIFQSSAPLPYSWCTLNSQTLRNLPRGSRLQLLVLEQCLCLPMLPLLMKPMTIMVAHIYPYRKGSPKPHHRDDLNPRYAGSNILDSLIAELFPGCEWKNVSILATSSIHSVDVHHWQLWYTCKWSLCLRVRHGVRISMQERLPPSTLLWRMHKAQPLSSTFPPYRKMEQMIFQKDYSSAAQVHVCSWPCQRPLPKPARDCLSQCVCCRHQRLSWHQHPVLFLSEWRAWWGKTAVSPSAISCYHQTPRNSFHWRGPG